MENKIPTAEEFFTNNLIQSSIDENGDYSIYDIKQAMIEFTKLHVTEALKQASEKAEVIEEWNTGFSGSAASVNKESILNAYSLDNIK